MKLIRSSVEIIPQETGYEGILKHIELCGRIYDKSENKITENSAKDFVEALKTKGNLSLLEHGTVYLRKLIKQVTNFVKIYNDSKGSIAVTNYRFAYENGLISFIDNSITNPAIKRITVRFIIPIGIKCEFIKYCSLFSLSEQLSRYCNHTFSKFGNESTFIEPYWWDSNIDERLEFLQSCEMAEKMYLQLIKRRMMPQFAQDVLPLSTKTELIMTGFVDDWKQFFTQQCSENAHPQVRKLVLDLQELFKVNNLL